MYKKIIKIIKILFTLFEWTIFLFLLALFCVLLLPLLPTQKYISSYVIPTGSMVPTIHVGSLVLVNPRINTHLLQSGTIIAFTDPQHTNITVVHRIIDVMHKNNAVVYKTKGDNNNGQDPWVVSPAQVKGVFLVSLPYVGYLSQATTSPAGFGFLVILPSLLLILLQIKHIKEGIEEEVAKRTALALEKKRTEITMQLLLMGVLTLSSMYLLFPFMHLAYGKYTAKITINNVSIGK